MFYEQQPQYQKENYKKMLVLIGNLTRLFSDNSSPYLPYRAHENIFCKYFDADNLSRKDCSADAKKNTIGIGLKTWVGNDDQKVAEFGKLKDTFDGLNGVKLVKKIAEYRNERIRVTKNMHGIDDMIYHIVKRVPGSMQILEYAFDYIDINNISVIKNRGNKNNTYFTDGKHTYHFSSSKNTLYMIFENMDLVDSFEVEIMEDPYAFLMCAIGGEFLEDITYEQEETLPKICLRLYSETKEKGKFVAEHSGLNQWNGTRLDRKSGIHKPRNCNELYIPYPAEDRKKTKGFFPDRGKKFNLKLPDGSVIPAAICQEAHKKVSSTTYRNMSAEEKAIEDSKRKEGKALMSTPNKKLGKWLLRNVFELSEGTLVTYEMLEKFGIDSVIITKHNDLEYSIDFAEIGTYEEFYRDE